MVLPKYYQAEYGYFSLEDNLLDLASLIGLIGCAGVVLFGMLLGGTMEMYWDFPSLVIVVGGAGCGVLTRWPLNGFIAGLMAGLKAISSTIPSPKLIIDQIVELADVARKGSILALEKVSIEDPFLAKCVKFMVDGYDPKVIDDLIELEIDNLSQRHSDGRAVFENFAEAAPAFGMIGTVVGLIVIMANLADPDKLGPGLAVALITTLYGAMMANMVFIPVAQKLKWRSGEETLNMNIIRYGVASITKGENPRSIREKLESFLTGNARGASEG